MSQVAFGDESIRTNVYVFVGSPLNVQDVHLVREAVRALAPRPGRRFHWHDQAAGDREKAARVVADLASLQVVVVAAPLDPRRQERGRWLALARLLYELETTGVTQVWLEARTAALNAKDLAAVDAWRSQRVVGHSIRVDHAYPSAEPLLWVPDIVAGAVSAAYAGELVYRDILDPVITEHRVILD